MKEEKRTEESTLTYPCPRCKTPVVYNRESPFRPFCSDRCKLIDIGAWADESYAVPGPVVGLEDQDDEEDEE